MTGAPTGNPIYLVGSVAALGSWNTANAIPMTAAGSNWTKTVTLPASTAVEYKFIAKDGAGNVTWEPGEQPHRTRSPRAAPAPSTPAGTAPRTTQPAVTFNATVTTVLGQNVYVIGSIPALGSWNTANAIALSSAAYPVWSGTVTVPASTAVEYKFIKKDGAGNVTWESGANRTLNTGTASQTVNATWK